MEKIKILLIFITILGLISLAQKNKKETKNIPKNLVQPTISPKISPSKNKDFPATEVIAEGLDTPWSLVFVSPDTILYTERQGRVGIVNLNKPFVKKTIGILSKVVEVGEGGLLGAALHPGFSKNHFIYFYYTYKSNSHETLNRVVKMFYDHEKLSDEKTIIDKIPGAQNHNGGRIKFGPDNYLYVTTGDAQNPSRAQDKNSLSGKILRVINDGKIEVYSYGHRNPQGLAWDSRGRLWATEHGRSGILSGLDEINLIEKGKNYGWPIIQGNEVKIGMEVSKLNSGGNTWAPSGAAFIGNSLYFGGLRGKTLYEAVVKDNQIFLNEHLQNEFGRIRDVVVGPDKMLYMTTSNRDGRGIPTSNDDRIVRVNPAKL